ncbi:MAG: T9SS type A sorting domain-containing protein [Saprospiraceae bacterium]|nr:T9SS type A sorting domain-containing protein [Saprospiraceae bacterium]
MKIIFLFLSMVLLQMQILSAQCHPDRHNTSWHDGWISCEANNNPNSARGLSHWILYNFGQQHPLGTIKFWNVNDPFNLDMGLRNINLDYSLDGVTWLEWGSVELPQADGKSNYEGPDLNGLSAQYILLTATDNYGGTCYGLSEIRFATTEAPNADMTTASEDLNFCMSVKVYPNPFIQNPALDIQSNCASNIQYHLTDAVGRRVGESVVLDGQSNVHQDLAFDNLIAGVYFLYIQNGAGIEKKKLIKME